MSLSLTKRTTIGDECECMSACMRASKSTGDRMCKVNGRCLKILLYEEVRHERRGSDFTYVFGVFSA